MDTSPAVTYVLEGTQCTVTYVSSNVTRLLEYSVEEVLAPHWWFETIHPDDRERAISEGLKVLLEGRVVREYRVRKKSGDYIWIRDELVLFKDGEPAAENIVGSWVDISEQKQAEEANLRSLRLSSIGTFTAGIAHELNAPLGGLLLAAQWARHLLESKGRNREVAKALDDIVETSERCCEIVTSLIRFARLELSVLNDHDITEVATAAVQLLKPASASRKVSIVGHYDTSLPQIAIDRVQMRQVIANLLKNAIDVADREVHLSTCFDMDRQAALLSVADDGPGISEEARKHLFDPFFSTTGGKGLGLALVHAIVEAHGGWVEVDTSDTGGALFKVYLPIPQSVAGPCADYQRSYSE